MTVTSWSGGTWRHNGFTIIRSRSWTPELLPVLCACTGWAQFTARRRMHDGVRSLPRQCPCSTPYACMYLQRQQTACTEQLAETPRQTCLETSQRILVTNTGRRARPEAGRFQFQVFGTIGVVQWRASAVTAVDGCTACCMQQWQWQ